MTHPTDALRLVPNMPTVELTDDMLFKIETGETLTYGELKRRLAAAPASPLPEGGGWQDIITAPKDGTVIDAWRKEGGRETVFWGYPHHECGEMGGLCDSDWHSIRSEGWVCNYFNEFLGRSHNPFTHWMPLPAAPTGAK